MHARTGSHIDRAAPVLALSQAAALALTLILASELHRHTCMGVCAVEPPALAAPAGPPAEPAARSCCHGPEEAAQQRPGQASSQNRHDGSPGGCTCLDDCCTLYAHGTTPDAAPDAGPAVLHVAAAHGTPAPAPPRATRPRLLPYPNGPPPTA